MNGKQKKIVIATGIAILAMTLYPPFHGIWKGNSMNFGYNFIFSPPNVISSVNVGTLFIQYVVIGIIGGFIWFSAKDKN
jgi:hypothetical protein